MADIKVYDPTTGDVLQTISDPMRAHMTRQVIKYMCTRKITCPLSGHILDMRTCVALVKDDGDVAYVMAPQAWALYRSNWDAVAARFPGIGVTSGRVSSLALPKPGA